MANPAAVSISQILQFIEKTKRLWDEKNLQDIELWRSYREEFENYTKNDFNRINKIQFRGLRRFFKIRNVWISQDGRISIAKTLANILNEGKCTVWSKNEILKCDCEEHFTSPKIRWMLNGKKERAAQTTALKFRKFSSSARSEVLAFQTALLKISKSSVVSSALLSTPVSAPAEILKPPAPASAPLAAPLATLRSISSEIPISLMQLSTPQQTKQPTSSPPEKTGQNQPAPQQQPPVQQFQSSQPPTFLQAAASLINPTPPPTATSFGAFSFTSKCISYRKGMG